MASFESAEKGAVESVTQTQASYARVAADLTVSQSRGATDSQAALADIAMGVLEQSIRGDATIGQIEKSLQASIVQLGSAVLANLELMEQQELAAAESRAEGQEYRDRDFYYVAKATIEELVDRAENEVLHLDEIQAALNAVSMVASFVPIVGQAVSAGIDLLNATISLARGNYLDASLYAFSAIPIVGDAAAVGRTGHDHYERLRGQQHAAEGAPTERQVRGSVRRGPFALRQRLALETTFLRTYPKASDGLQIRATSRGFRIGSHSLQPQLSPQENGRNETLDDEFSATKTPDDRASDMDSEGSDNDD